MELGHNRAPEIPGERRARVPTAARQDMIDVNKGDAGVTDRTGLVFQGKGGGLVNINIGHESLTDLKFESVLDFSKG